MNVHDPSRWQRQFEGSGEQSTVVEQAPDGAAAVELAALDLAASLYRLRRLRDGLFHPGLFQDPAWDLLLDLFIASQRGKPICISSACIAASAPPTTALRHLGILEELGYLERTADPADGRRQLVRLSAEASARMVSLLGTAACPMRPDPRAGGERKGQPRPPADASRAHEVQPAHERAERERPLFHPR